MCSWNTSEVVALPPNIDVSKENRSVSLDRCIANIIPQLWANSIDTRGCCCGHGKENPSVVIARHYSDEDIKRINNILLDNDSREWSVLQWKLVEVSRMA